jgi:hypothetical protein
MIQKSVGEIRQHERIWGLDIEALANPNLWTLHRTVDDGETIEEVSIEVEVIEEFILEKMVQETRAG